MDNPRSTPLSALILLLTDAPDRLAALVMVLLEQGYQVALQTIHQWPNVRLDKVPELILLDGNLPDGDAWYQRLKQTPTLEPVPIVLVGTGKCDRASFLAAGGAETISLPIDTQELLHKLQIQLTLYRQQQQLASQAAQLQRLSQDCAVTKITLEQSEEKFAKIFFNNPNPIGISNLADGRILEVNARFIDLFGYSREELIGRTALELNLWANPQDRQRIITALRNRQPVQDQETRGRTKSGRLITVLLSSEIFEFEGQSCFFVTLNDITDRKETEARLQQRAEADGLVSWIARHLLDSELDMAIDLILAEIGEFLGGDRCAMICGSVEDDRLKMAHEWCQEGIPSMIAEMHEFDPNDYPWVKTQLQQAQVIRLNQLSDLPAEATIERCKLANAQVQSSLIVPMVNGGKTVGYLGMDAISSARAWSDQDVNLLKLLGELIAIAQGRHEAEKNLQRRAKIDSLISRIARQLLDQDLDTAIAFALKEIGEFTDSDRANIIQCLSTEPPMVLSMTHEWCRDGISPTIQTMQNFSSMDYPWISQQLVHDRPLHVRRIADLPPEAIATKAMMERGAIQSFLVVPMLNGETVVGFLGLDAVRAEKTWSQGCSNLFKLAGELIAIGQARHHAENALKQAKDMADAANRAKSEFLANMSHELRTPLNAILGFTQVMGRDTNLNADQQKYLGIINRSGEHLLELINDILEMSKIEAGRVTLHETSFDLYRLLNTLEEMLQLRAKAKNLQLIFDYSRNVPQFICTDEGKLRQVLLNLLGNALKFTEEGGVTLRVRPAQPEAFNLPSPDSLLLSSQVSLHFEVEDTGLGIADHEIDRLFEAFSQTTAGQKSQQGTGLGLPISRRFVQLMGGEISVTSRVNQGSLFAFQIRVKLGDIVDVDHHEPARRVTKLAPNQPDYRVLVVDDRAESRLLLVKLLSSRGFLVQEAENGQVAIAHWKTWQPHLILMDMQMPVLDGYNATRRIRSLESFVTCHLSVVCEPTTNDQPPTPNPQRQRTNDQSQTTNSQQPIANSQQPRTKIIALTASAFEEDRQMVLAAGCDDFMRKPFREQVLFERIAQQLPVQYCYEEGETTIVPDVSPSSSNLNHALQAMPGEWLDDLRRAATECSDDRILELVQHIPPEQTQLIKTLQQLAENFLFAEIIDLMSESLP